METNAGGEIEIDIGVVTARRNDRRRWFDFPWMLHIMDYQTREDCNATLLQMASALGLVTVLSGFTLATVTSSRLNRLFRKRQG